MTQAKGTKSIDLGFSEGISQTRVSGVDHQNYPPGQGLTLWSNPQGESGKVPLGIT